MPYLSRIRINPLRSASRGLLANPRKLHAAVTGGIADDPLQQRLLWRLDSDNPHRPHLVVLTATKPDWTHIVEQAGWPDADGEHTRIRDYTPLLNRLATGDEYVFRVTANPVQNTSTPDKPSDTQRERGARRRSHRIGHRTTGAQLRWFTQRAPTWGFDLAPSPVARHAPDSAEADQRDLPEQARYDMRVANRNRLSFPKSGGKPVVLHTATFEGRLRIRDPEQFRRTLVTGIGPAKAYGCGLLTLAPLADVETVREHDHG